MIIVCPACETRYDLPEGAIGPDGRTVRCAQCRHSWFEPGPDALDSQAELEGDAPLESEGESATGITGAAEPSAEPAAPVAAPGTEPLPEESEEAGDQAYDPPARRRRSRLWLWLLLLVLLMAAAIGGTLTWYAQPDWLPIRHTAMVTSSSGLALDFPSNLIERKTLADGTEFFGARGTVTNTTANRRAVPPIEILLRDTRQQVVYRWQVVPPKSQLNPGESMTITEAVTDIPSTAIIPQIRWKAV